jgi:hypothetical protein
MQFFHPVTERTLYFFGTTGMFKTKKIIVIFQDSTIIANSVMYVNLAPAAHSATEFFNREVEKVMGTFLARSAKNRAFRSKSSDLPMQILWAFRCNPLRAPSGY